MPKTLLIVDDDPDIVISMSSYLRKRDFYVLEAKSAEEALAVLKAQRPDLIITDVLLPQMNGYEFVKQIRNSSQMQDIPILVMTGRGQMKEAFQVIGVSGFISKPFSPEDLHQWVKDILSIQEVAVLGPQERKKRVLIIGRPVFENILKDIQDIVEQLKCEGRYVCSVPEAVAKTVEFAPDAFIVDVQLADKHSAELVNIIRHLPNYEENPIIGFCYYNVGDLPDPSSRQAILTIQHDAEKFLESGASVFVERYIREEMIDTIKNYILDHGKTVK